ncbi:MAG: glycosyltransferase family 4 protein [Syntrophorhabdus sp.]|nr:glycosyltransferase family 4 protein [Syntrophorhabdus sp.]
MKILVSAYACEPGKGSEPEVGWQWVRQIARFHETWVITRSNNRASIEEGLRRNPNPNLNFVYVDLPDWARFWKRGNRGVHVYYYFWQVLVYCQARKLLRHTNFDAVQHITFVNMYVGPWLALIQRPFVWGPIGANPDIPRRCYPLLGSSGVADNHLRFVIRKVSPFVDPIIHVAQRRATRILTINQEVRSRLMPELLPKTIALSQNAIDQQALSRHHKTHHRPLRILCVGQLVSIKAHRLSLIAFKEHLSHHQESLLELIGDGPQRSELTLLAENLGISKKVTFVGRITRDKVLRAMEDNDAFLFPSFEGAGMVVLEAMAKGLPVVCLDFGGPGEYVTEECGIKVALTEPREVVSGLASGLSRLATDSELYERLSIGAIKRVQENYLWDRIGDRLNTLYREVHEQAESKVGKLHGRKS